MKLGDLPGVSPASRLRGLCNAATVAVPRRKDQERQLEAENPFPHSQSVDGVGLKGNSARCSKAGLVSTNQVYREVYVIS